MSDDMKIVTVTSEAWRELNDITSALTASLGQWCDTHQLPVQAGLGALTGIYVVVATLADACDCEACHAAEDQMARELESRMLGTGKVKH